MIVNGVQLPNPDTADVLFMEKLEREQDAVTNWDENPEIKTRAQKIRAQCTAIFNFFDNMFGDGTAKKVFGEKVNLITCVDAYDEVLTEINRVDAELASKLRAKYVSKYLPDKGKKPKNKRYNNRKQKRR